jgi:starch phosphorylase
VAARRAEGYAPRACYEADEELRDALNLIGSGFFSRADRELFRPIVDALLHRDEYMALADYRAYVDAQARAGEAYGDEEAWTRMSILNTARSGRFSSDRSIREYCETIWHVRPLNANG